MCMVAHRRTGYKSHWYNVLRQNGTRTNVNVGYAYNAYKRCTYFVIGVFVADVVNQINIHVFLLTSAGNALTLISAYVRSICMSVSFVTSRRMVD